MERHESTPLCASTLASKHIKEDSQKFKVYYCIATVTHCPNFDDLWYIILKLLIEKGDHVTSQGVVCITVIMR